MYVNNTPIDYRQFVNNNLDFLLCTGLKTTKPAAASFFIIGMSYIQSVFTEIKR
jgi:hypothetical protein